MSDSADNFKPEMLETFANFPLSTGQIVTLASSNFEEGYESFDNLIISIVDEHFEELLKTLIADGNDDDNATQILEKEVVHILDNVVSDHKRFLSWIFMTFLLKRFDYILNEIKKEKPHLFESDK